MLLVAPGICSSPNFICLSSKSHTFYLILNLGKPPDQQDKMCKFKVSAMAHLKYTDKRKRMDIDYSSRKNSTTNIDMLSLKSLHNKLRVNTQSMQVWIPNNLLNI